MKRSALLFSLLGLLSAPVSSNAQAVRCPVEWNVERELAYHDETDPIGGVGEVAVLRGGYLAVADRMAADIKLFNVQGTLVRTIGRKGRGPGEFQYIVTLVERGDSIWVFDQTLQRETVLRRDGTVVRTASVLAEAGQRYHTIRPLAGGYVGLVAVEVSSLTADTVTFQPLHLLQGLPVAGPHAVPPLAMRRGMATMEDAERGIRNSFSLPTPFNDFVAADPRSSRALVLRGQIYEESGVRSVNVTAISPRGDTAFTRTISMEPAPVDRAWIADQRSIIENWLVPGYSSRSKGLDELNRAWRVGAHHAPVTNVITAQDGRLWMESDPSKRRWHVLEVEANRIACVEFPQGVRPVAAAYDRVWAVRRLEDETPVIERFRVR